MLQGAVPLVEVDGVAVELFEGDGAVDFMMRRISYLSESVDRGFLMNEPSTEPREDQAQRIQRFEDEHELFFARKTFHGLCFYLLPPEQGNEVRAVAVFLLNLGTYFVLVFRGPAGACHDAASHYYATLRNEIRAQAFS